MTPPPADCPVLLIVGDEGLLVRKAEQAAVEAAFGGGSPGFNLATYSAEDGAGDALSQARTLPMMAKRRVVVVRQMHKAPVALLDALLAYVENPNPSTTLVLSGKKMPGASGGVDRGKRIENRVKKLGGLQRFGSREVRPLDFIQQTVAERGCTIDPRAARMLLELVGSDLGQLELELGKAIAWVGGSGAIASADVEAVCSVVSEAVIWDLTDAVISGDPDRGLAAALRMLDDAGSGGAHRLLSTITWQVRELLALQEAIHTGQPPPGSWRRVPRSKLEAAKANLKRRVLDPARIMGALTQANRDFNRSRAGDRRVFEGLVLALTTASA